MLSLTKINGKTILLNEHLIESVEEMPDTTVILATGNVVIVKEKLASIMRKAKTGAADATLLAAVNNQKKKKKGARRG